MYFNPPNPFDDASRMARSVIWSSKNVVPIPDWAEGMLGKNYLRYIQTRVRPADNIPDKADYENCLNHPNAIRYRFQTVGRMVHPGVQAFAPWRVELARLDVPRGSVGILRSIEQYIATPHIGGGWTKQNNIEDPFADIDAGVSGRWIMRLSPFDGTIIPWVNVLNPIPELPGIPHSDWQEQIGTWYPCGSDGSMNVRLMVPGGFTLRGFWECGTLQVQPAVALAFKGSVQGAYSGRSLDVTRGSW